MEKVKQEKRELSDEDLMIRTALDLANAGFGMVGAAALDFGATKKEVENDKDS